MLSLSSLLRRILQMIPTLAGGVLVAFLLVFGAHADGADPQETRALYALFDRNWEDISQRFPEGSTYRGDLRFNDRLSDESAGAIAAYDAQVRQWLAEAKAIRRERLAPPACCPSP
jgi:uncharacterized protein (DUF885 family)